VEQSHPGAIEAHHGALSSHPIPLGAHLGVLEAHPQALDAHLIPWRLTFESSDKEQKHILELTFLTKLGIHPTRSLGYIQFFIFNRIKNCSIKKYSQLKRTIKFEQNSNLTKDGYV
jgi:hypothetical protein